MIYFTYIIFAILINLGISNYALANPHHYCYKYIEEASRKTGVLPELLWAVAKTESNYKSGPWPWTINYKGKGYYFPSKLAAKRFLQKLPKNALFYTDVGCMQLNWGYHGTSFTKISQMLNPRLNVLYAAYYLKELYHETGKWAKAVAAYHSRKWFRGGRYANYVALHVKDYLKKQTIVPQK